MTERRPHTPLAVAFRRPWPGTRRGLKLWLLAIIIGLKGVVYLDGAAPSTSAALELVTERLRVPVPIWGAVVITLCTVAAFCAYCHHGRDRYGYMILTGYCLAWAACYAVTPLLLDGPTYAWQGALTYVAIAGFLLLCADDDA